MLQTTILLKSLLSLIDMAKSDKVDIVDSGSDYEDKTVKR